jgi:uncharacterized protein HemX
MPEFRAPRVRMPRVTLPGRAGGRATKPTTSNAETEEQPKGGNGANPAETKEATQPTTAKAPTKSAATETAAGSKAPEANLQERMEGLQGWMAEIERKQGRMTYFGLAGLVIAILAAGAALYFGLTAKSDSATKGDLDSLTKRIDSLEAAATKNSKDTQAALNASVAQLQQSIAAIQKQQSQDSANIATLQRQASAGALRKGTAAGTTITPTPGTTTTTPAGK